MNKQLNIFAVYTWEDKNVLLHVLRELKTFKEKNSITIWDDNPINGKQKWVPNDESQINNADVFLFFLSNDFMRSEFINQVEFKNIIDRYKENKTKVIPILVDESPWNIEFRADDYNFNFNELDVLPAQEKPIENWDEPDQAFKNIALGIQKAIIPSKVFTTTLNNDLAVAKATEVEIVDIIEMPENDSNLSDFDLSAQDQIRMDFAQEAEKLREVNEAREQKEEIALKKKLAETHRLNAEDEAKLKVGTEEVVVSEEELKRQAELEKERIAKAELKRKEELERLEELLVERERQKEHSDEIIEQQKVHEHKEETYQEEFLEEEFREKGILQALLEKISKRSLIVVGLIALVLFSGIWIFSGSDSSAFSSSDNEMLQIEDGISVSEIEINASESEAKMLSNGEVGKTFDGGIIFSFDSETNTGKIINTKDSGKMPWKNAMEIHKKLGVGWRLPTIEELILIQKTVGPGGTNIGDFTDDIYWSATPYDVDQARLVRFSDGNSTFHYNLRADYRKFLVRAVRDFEK